MLLHWVLFMNQRDPPMANRCVGKNARPAPYSIGFTLPQPAASQRPCVVCFMVMS